MRSWKSTYPGKYSIFWNSYNLSCNFHSCKRNNTLCRKHL